MLGYIYHKNSNHQLDLPQMSNICLSQTKSCHNCMKTWEQTNPILYKT